MARRKEVALGTMEGPSEGGRTALRILKAV